MKIKYTQINYRFGQFMVSTLPNFNQSEKGVALGFTNTLVEISKPSFDEDSQGMNHLRFSRYSTPVGYFLHPL